MTIEELAKENEQLQRRVKLLMDSHNSLFERIEDMEAKLDALADRAMTSLESLDQKLDREDDADWWKSGESD